MSIMIDILDAIHRLVFVFFNIVPETGLCLHPHLKPTQLGAIDRAGPVIGTSCSRLGPIEQAFT
jgi:hypothetical protein